MKRIVSGLLLVLTGTVFMGCQSTVAASMAYPDGAAGTITIDGSNPKTVSTRYGQNYWCWDGYGDNMPNAQALVGGLKLDVLRAGGYNNDAEKSTGAYGSDPFGDSQIDAFIGYCKSVGAAPVLQVPLIENYKANNGTAKPADAAAIVRYCNVTKGYGVEYWEIGNEPDLYGDVNNGAVDIPGYNVNRFCSDFNAFSSAMKAVDPSIRILGPELAWKYYPNQSGANDWLTPFLYNCKGGYDIVTVHRYPFAPGDCTIAKAMSDVSAYKDFVRSIEALVAGINPKPFAITESNITYDGDPSHSTRPASPQTFYAAMWVADTLGAAREQGLWAQHYWSLCESWTIGFIDPSTMKPRPEYYAFALVSGNMGSVELTSTAPAGFSVYASRNGSDTATVAIVLNKNATNDQETFALTRLAKAVGAAAFSYTFPAYSLSCVTIPDDGSKPGLILYTKAISDQGSGPQIQ